jgi:nitrogenase molybdenum-cofactor synthesis protein NifE
MYNFAREIHSSVMSPVWKFMPRRAATRATCAGKEVVNG